MLRGRIAAIDGLRGVAILSVIGYHTDALFGGQFGAPGNELMSRILGAGWIGVQLFFVLSGFLITSILLERKRRYGMAEYAGGFYWRRACRILPLYFGFLAVYLLLVRRLPDFNRAPSIPPADATSLFLFYYNFRGALHPVPVLNLYWSLCVEEQFYLLWPLLVWVCSEAALKRVCIAMAAGALLFRLAAVRLDHGISLAYFATPCVVDGLALGALVALLRTDDLAWSRCQRYAGRVALGLAMTVLAVALWQRHFFGNLDARYDFVPLPHDSWLIQTWGMSAVVLLFAAVLVAILDRESAAPSWLQQILAFPALRSVGFYSYAMYIFHRVVLHALNYIGDQYLPGYRAVSPSVAKPAMILIAAAACYALARVSYAVWEGPFLRLSARSSGR